MFKDRRSTEICRDLIGRELVRHEEDRSLIGGIIVEVEAYVGTADPACHLSGGITPRNRPFFGGPGNMYVFKVHGHNNLNFISTYSGQPECILIRALEPTRGIDRMRDRRGFDEESKLCSGPGKLTEALNIDKERHNNESLSQAPVELRSTEKDPEIKTTTRVGISQAEDWPLRFVADGNTHRSESRQSESTDRRGVEKAFQDLETSSPPEPEY